MPFSAEVPKVHKKPQLAQGDTLYCLPWFRNQFNCHFSPLAGAFLLHTCCRGRRNAEWSQTNKDKRNFTKAKWPYPAKPPPLHTQCPCLPQCLALLLYLKLTLAPLPSQECCGGSDPLTQQSHLGFSGRLGCGGKSVPEKQTVDSSWRTFWKKARSGTLKSWVPCYNPAAL